MDIQELLPPASDQRTVHYADPPSTTLQYHQSSPPATQPQTSFQFDHLTSSSSNSLSPSESTSTTLITEPTLTTIHEDESLSTTNNSVTDDIDFLQQGSEQPSIDTMNDTDFLPLMNPALASLGGRFDKRKSSPAILGLPFGITDDPQLDLHLSQHRNSIEAAMLLANFNRIPTVTKESPDDPVRGTTLQWQDDLSVPTHTQEKEVDQQLNSLRRHSYDVGMDWKSMSQQFKERTDLFDSTMNDAVNNEGSAFKPVLKQEQEYSHYTGGSGNSGFGSRITWTQDGLYHPTSSPARPYPPSLHPHMYSSNLHQQPPLLHPLARQHSANDDHHSTHKRAYTAPREHYSYSHYGDQQRHPYQQQPYYFPAPHRHPHPPPPQTPHPSVIGKLPLPPNGMYQPHPHLQQQQHLPPPPGHHLHHPHPIIQHPPGEYTTTGAGTGTFQPAGVMIPPNPIKPKRRRFPKEEEIVEAGDADFPDMCPRDVELARTDPEARPRRQKLRFHGDMYTPKWVRYNGQSKEGLCDTCQPGRWLQLKNSAYWYHKQFYHGISSVSGSEFVKPVDTRWVDQDLVEGLCHQCHQWVAVSNVKRKNSVLWFRHAHKCHVYHKPKTPFAREQ